MSHLRPKLAMIAGSAVLLALLGISTDAQAARKKPAAGSTVQTQTYSNAVRSSYGYQSPGLPRNAYSRPAPGTNILHGGPSAGWSGPP